MIKKYKEFKKIFNHSDDFYEKYSIDDNDLFGNTSFYSDEFLENNYKLPISTINKFKQELQETYLKYKYIYGFLEKKEKELKEQNVQLDKEFLELNEYSTKGQSFLKMFDMPDYYNNVIDYKIIYQKNITKVNDVFVKTKDSLEPLSFYLEYVGENSFFITFDNLYIIRDIFLDFYDNVTYSIFGVKKDDTMENLFSNVDSTNKFFTNTNETKFKKLFITGIKDINQLLRNIKIFSYTDINLSEKNGFLVYNLQKLENIKEFIIVSDDETELFLFDRNTYLNVINMLSTNEKLCIESFFTTQYKVQKNVNIKNTQHNELFIVEYFKKTQFKSNELKIFAKEVNNNGN